MTRQLSDCCKAPIDFYPKLERPECYRCSFCDRVIGSPIPEKSVKEIVEEFSNEWERIIDCSGTVRAGLDDWLTQTLQAERQKREEMVKTTAIRELMILQAHLDKVGNLTVQIGSIYQYINDRAKALTQPNNQNDGMPHPFANPEGVYPTQ